MNKKIILQTTALWLSFFLLVGLVTHFANFRYNLYGDALYPSDATAHPAPKLDTLKFWHNLYRWDAGWYAEIAQTGYNEKSIAFFPLYPLVLAGVMKLFRAPNAFPNAAFLISLICVWFSLYTLLKLAESEGSGRSPLLPALLFLFSPTSFFLAVPYSEALFIMLLLFMVRAQSLGRNVITAILTFLLSLARINGVMVIPFLLWNFLHIPPSRKRQLQDFLPAIGSLSGFVAYALYQKTTLGNFFAFLDAQHLTWGRNTIVGLGSIIGRYNHDFRELAEATLFQPAAIVSLTNIIFAVGSIVAIGLLVYWGKKDYAILSAGLMCLPFLSGSFYSMPRLVLPLVPLFAIVLNAKVASPNVMPTVLLVCAIFWALFLASFSRLYWVA